MALAELNQQVYLADKEILQQKLIPKTKVPPKIKDHSNNTSIQWLNRQLRLSHSILQLIIIIIMACCHCQETNYTLHLLSRCPSSHPSRDEPLLEITNRPLNRHIFHLYQLPSKCQPYQTIVMSIKFKKTTTKTRMEYY